MRYNNEQEYEAQFQTEIVQEELNWCNYCWNQKKNKENELFFLDNANNMRICKFCPNCGRKYT